MSEPASSLPRLIAVGIIGKPIGVEGACAVTPYGATLERFGVPRELYVGSSETACRRIVLEKTAFRGKRAVCHFSGITTIESAAKICGLMLFVTRDTLPQLEEGGFYHFDLMGLKVGTDQGRELGTVVAVHNFPTIDSVEVTPSEGETVVIPLSERAVAGIDRQRGYLTVRHSFIEDLL
ncbi:MAG: 16S rRNA processing protein RimM [Chitinispirillaceae bacterium]|nr:16S rRNA processing protein RimM [Chitinispirillaceae bacterium]